MTIALLAVAVLAVAVLAACRPRDDASADSEAADTTRPDDTAQTAATVSSDSASVTAAAPRQDRPRRTPPIRRAGESPKDSIVPPDDSVRAMRPEMPQVTPEKRPRTWRGFKLPEEMPVRAPVETIQRVEQMPDSVIKGDPPKPPTPAR